jgi:integrase/recombinase XerC
MAYQLFRIGGIWHYRYSINSVRVQRSTRETVKYRAQEIAEDAFNAAKLRERGREPVPTLRQLCSAWADANAWAESAAHVKSIDVFCRLHLFDLADLPIDELTTELVDAARKSFAESHAPSSVNQWVKILKLLVKWAKRRKMIKEVPFDIGLIKIQKKPRAILPPALALKWLASIDGQHRSDAVSVAARMSIGLGLRESEIASARWEFVNWDRLTYSPGQTKDRKSSPIPMPDWLVEYLTPRRRSSGLIVTQISGAPLYPGFMRAAMLRANEACEAPHITPHRLRGTFATMLSESGTPVQEIQRVLRHGSILTTAGYLEANPDLTRAGQRHIAARLGLNLAEKLEDAGEKLANTTQQSPVIPRSHDYQQ